MANPVDDSAGESQLDLLIADYLMQVDERGPIDIDEFLKDYPHLADDFQSYLRDADLADKLSARDSQAGPSNHKPSTDQQETTPSMAVDETLAVRPQRAEYQSASEEPSRQSIHIDGLPYQFGRYRLLEELGSGAMGSVYLAEDADLHRRVALKITRFSRTADAEAMLERFYREARAAANLSHPNICPVYDIGEYEGTSYITMGMINGKTLADVIHRGARLDVGIAVNLIRKVALALAEAHKNGIVHRDLKPSNIMVDGRNEPIVMDFGLAREMTRTGDEQLTHDGMIVGTPTYMSPEQVEGVQDRVRAPSDVYSLGIVFYEMLTGTVPFSGGTMRVLGQIIAALPAPPSTHRVDLSPAVESICMKMIAKDQANRYGSMQEVAKALSDLLRTGSETVVQPQSGEITALTGPELKAQAEKVHALTKASKWLEAEKLLQSMAANSSPIAANYAQWATEQLSTVRHTIEQKRGEAIRALQEAQSRMKRHDYVGVINRLRATEASLSPPAVSALMQEATVSSISFCVGQMSLR